MSISAMHLPRWVYLLGGAVLLLLSFYWQYKLQRYEFENRTAGGMIQFKSYGASIFHPWKKRLMWLVSAVGGLLVLTWWTSK